MATVAKLTAVDHRARSIELTQARDHTSCSWPTRLISLCEDEPTGSLLSAAWRIASASSGRQSLVTRSAADEDAR